MMNIYDLLKQRRFDGGGLLDTGNDRLPTPDYNEVERPLYVGEMAYFAQNPQVAGMMTPDQRVAMPPDTRLGRENVKRNEYARLLLQDYKPESGLSDEQRKFFKGTPYEGDEGNAFRSVLARLLTGDPSVRATFGQDKELRQLLQPSGLLGGY